MAALETIDFAFNGTTIQLIPTEGGYVDNCGKIVGLFSCEEDVRSDDPDAVAWGTVGWDRLTEDQQAVATRNTELLESDTL